MKKLDTHKNKVYCTINLESGCKVSEDEYSINLVGFLGALDINAYGGVDDVTLIKDCIDEAAFEEPPFLAGGAIDNRESCLASILPYGALIPPFGTYQIPEVLYLPIRIVRVPNSDERPPETAKPEKVTA